MKTKILIIGLKFIGVAALMLAACSTGNSFAILVGVAVLLFVLVGDNIINRLMFAGAGFGLIIGLAASALAAAVRHQGLGIEMWDDLGNNGALLIPFCVWGWVQVANYAKKFIPLTAKPKN